MICPKTVPMQELALYITNLLHEISSAASSGLRTKGYISSLNGPVIGEDLSKRMFFLANCIVVIFQILIPAQSFRE